MTPLLLAGLLTFTSPPAPDRYTMLLAGNEAGHMTVLARDGVRSVHFEFNDRGRGPKIDATYRLSRDGLPLAVDIEGVAYLKTPVSEHFAIEDGTATWKTGTDSGSAKPTKPAFYWSLDGAPEEVAILARALLAAKSLDLLPGGHARIERLASRKVRGKERILYAIFGISLTPELVWLDDNGELFASVSEWSSLIRDGFEGEAAALLTAQNAIQDEQARRRAERLTTRLERPVLFRDVRAYDPDRGEFVGDAVLVSGGRIEKIGRGLTAPKGATVIDGAGRFLMPGLWDMHVHLGGSVDGLLHLGSGVTTVRDLANDNDLLARRASDYEAGRDIGPRILKGGFLDGPGPFAGPTKALVADADAVHRWIDRYAKEGYVQIKLYSSLDVALVPDAIRYAHDKGLRVSGHVPVGLNASEFVAMGADELQHINFVFLNFLAGEGDDTRTPVRFTLVADRGAQLDLTGREVQAFVEMLVAKGTVVDPTLATFEDMFVAQPGAAAPSFAAILPRLPATWQRSIVSGRDGLEAKDARAALTHRLAYERMVAMVGVLHRAGVRLVAGTDSIAGLALARELELYVQAGITPRDVLRIATTGAAEVMGVADRGRLAPGQTADLVLVDGDPTLLVSDLRSVQMVLCRDRLYDAQALLGAAGLTPPE